ncbi:MAG: TIR domain-containing protein [Chloroflexi bacterium]|nr:TIR domain-containing protein [Chloroflexota bacterium]
MIRKNTDVTSTRHILPFGKLSSENFERLCFWIIEELPDFDEVQHYGGVGDKNRDIIAYKHSPSGKREQWYFQCKNYKKVSPSIFKTELDAIREHSNNNKDFKPDVIIFVAGCRISPRCKDDVNKHAKLLSLGPIYFWGEVELDEKAKMVEGVVEEFFRGGISPDKIAKKTVDELESRFPYVFKKPGKLTEFDSAKIEKIDTDIKEFFPIIKPISEIYIKPIFPRIPHTGDHEKTLKIKERNEEEHKIINSVKTRKPKIFIAYAHENRDTKDALRLYDDLKEANCEPWIDKKDLLGGKNWKIVIPQNIKKSDFFLACLSKKSVSKTGFFQTELKEAYEILKKYPSDKIFIIPIRLEECEVPPELEHLHWLNLFEPDGFEQVLKSIQEEWNNRGFELPPASKKETKNLNVIKEMVPIISINTEDALNIKKELVRNYEIVKTEDSSIKALDKPVSAYNTNEIEILPMNIRNAKNSIWGILVIGIIISFIFFTWLVLGSQRKMDKGTSEPRGSYYTGSKKLPPKVAEISTPKSKETGVKPQKTMKTPLKTTEEPPKTIEEKPKLKPVVTKKPAPEEERPITQKHVVGVKKISLEVVDMDLIFFLRLMAKELNMNLVVDPRVQGNVTTNLKDVTPEGALSLVLTEIGFNYMKVDNTLIVGPQESLKRISSEKPILQMVELENAKPHDVVKYLEDKFPAAIWAFPDPTRDKTIIIVGHQAMMREVRKAIAQFDSAKKIEE